MYAHKAGRKLTLSEKFFQFKMCRLNVHNEINVPALHSDFSPAVHEWLNILVGFRLLADLHLCFSYFSASQTKGELEA